MSSQDEESGIPWNVWIAHQFRCPRFWCPVPSCPTKELGAVRSEYEPSLASGVRACLVCGKTHHFTREARRDDPFPLQEEYEREYREHLERVDLEGDYAPAINRFGVEG